LALDIGILIVAPSAAFCFVKRTMMPHAK